MKRILLILIFTFALFGILGCAMLSLVGYINQGEAERLEEIKRDDVVRVKAFSRDENEREISSDDIDTVLEFISKAEPMRASHNDSVYSEDYRGIMIVTNETVHYYYIYKKGSRTILEVPYIGVYKVDRELFKLINGYFE